MNIEGKTALVLGGAGLVGQAVCRRLAGEGAACLLVAGLTEAEATEAVDRLASAGGSAGPIRVPVWGDVFVRAEFAFEPRSVRQRSIEIRDRCLADDLEELTDAIYANSHLVQLILGRSSLAPGRTPDLVVDAINTATALAYTGVYSHLQHILKVRRRGDPESMAGEVDALLGSFATPRLVRHVQLLARSMAEAGTEAYVKVGTTGTGGMGLNIPYTHGEERPSRQLLTKSALAGAHSMLLFLLARTPGAPAVKEIKPAAAITWKRIGYGPIRHRGQDLPVYDCRPGEGLSLQWGDTFGLDDFGAEAGGQLESVFIDTGENGLFSLGEYTAITALGQMEAVTPEDIARLVLRELKGQPTGRDIVAALDGAVTPPSYRAGQLRHRAIAEARELVAEHDVPSVAFEILGPPRLSKLLYEAELLRIAYGSLESVAAADPAELSEAMARTLASAHEVRRAAISVGVPVLMPNGRELLCATRQMRQHRWEQAGWVIDDASVGRWCHSEWIDLRPKNAARWTERARRMLLERRAERADVERSSALDRHFDGVDFDIGEVAAWILENEDGGYRD